MRSCLSPPPTPLVRQGGGCNFTTHCSCPARDGACELTVRDTRNVLFRVGLHSLDAGTATLLLRHAACDQRHRMPARQGLHTCSMLTVQVRLPFLHVAVAAGKIAVPHNAVP